MFLLVPAHPGCPGQIPQSRKTVVCVCVILKQNFKSRNISNTKSHYRWLQILVSSIYCTANCWHMIPLFGTTIQSNTNNLDHYIKPKHIWSEYSVQPHFRHKLWMLDSSKHSLEVVPNTLVQQWFSVLGPFDWLIDSSKVMVWKHTQTHRRTPMSGTCRPILTQTMNPIPNNPNQPTK